MSENITEAQYTLSGSEVLEMVKFCVAAQGHFSNNRPNNGREKKQAVYWAERLRRWHQENFPQGEKP